MTRRIFETSGGSQNASAFVDFLRYYARIAVWLLAALGVCLLLGLQFKWFGQVRTLTERPATDSPVIEISGSKQLFSKETFPVDTSKTYRLSVDIRVLPKSDGSPQASIVYYGVQTFDTNNRELTSGPGAYRYAGANQMRISSKEGWIRIGGLITGEGDENYNEFRPHTRSIKLVLLPNYGMSADTTVQIKDVEFSQRVSLAP